jgi:hypothetical protein
MASIPMQLSDLRDLLEESEGLAVVPPGEAVLLLATERALAWLAAFLAALPDAVGAGAQLPAANAYLVFGDEFLKLRCVAGDKAKDPRARRVKRGGGVGVCRSAQVSAVTPPPLPPARPPPARPRWQAGVGCAGTWACVPAVCHVCVPSSPFHVLARPRAPLCPPTHPAPRSRQAPRRRPVGAASLQRPRLQLQLRLPAGEAQAGPRRRTTCCFRALTSLTCRTWWHGPARCPWTLGQVGYACACN